MAAGRPVHPRARARAGAALDGTLLPPLRTRISRSPSHCARTPRRCHSRTGLSCCLHLAQVAINYASLSNATYSRSMGLCYRRCTHASADRLFTAPPPSVVVIFGPTASELLPSIWLSAAVQEETWRRQDGSTPSFTATFCNRDASPS